MESSVMSQHIQTGNHSVSLNGLLLEYYNALTHLCTVGAKLASRLENVLGTCDPKHCTIKSMDPLTYLYKDILASMGPLREETIFECCDEGQDEHYCKQVEACSTHLLNFHCQIIQRGSQLIQSRGDLKLNTEPGKHSPYIVVTDTDKPLPLDLHRSSEKSNRSVDSPSLQAKNHVPTDDDMNNIINFLSSTHIPKKTPLGNQRSSPLPKVASLTDNRHHPVERRLSDWQAYRNESVMCPEVLSPSEPILPEHCLPPKVTAVKHQTATPSISPPCINIPFNGVTRTWFRQDKIWTNNDSSSGDESLSTTDQLFNCHSLDLSGIVSQTRRSSHDSNASSQNFDMSCLLGHSVVQDDGWSRSSKVSWCNETKQSFNTFNDNVWKPLTTHDNSSFGTSSKGASTL